VSETTGFAMISRGEIRRLASLRLPYRAWALYVSLAAYRGKDGTCFPSLAELSDLLGRPKRSLRRDLHDLRDTGAIAYRRRQQRTPIYSFPLLKSEGPPPGLSGDSRGARIGIPEGPESGFQRGQRPAPRREQEENKKKQDPVSCKSTTERPTKKLKAPTLRSREELLARYDGRSQVVLGAMGECARTRATGSMSENLVVKTLEWMDRYPVEVVVSGCRIYVDRGYSSKGMKENYLMGIIRGEASRQDADPPSPPPTPIDPEAKRLQDEELVRLWNASPQGRANSLKQTEVKREG
jgi:hypothetical protein